MSTTADWTLKEALRSRALWLLMWCNLERSAINTALTFHMIAMMEERGFDKFTAASVLDTENRWPALATLSYSVALEEWSPFPPVPSPARLTA